MRRIISAATLIFGLMLIFVVPLLMIGRAGKDGPTTILIRRSAPFEGQAGQQLELRVAGRRYQHQLTPAFKTVQLVGTSGEWVYFIGGNGRQYDSERHVAGTLYRTRLQDNALELVVPTLAISSGVVWSPDSRWLYYPQGDGQGQLDLMRVRTDGQVFQNLTEGLTGSLRFSDSFPILFDQDAIIFTLGETSPQIYYHNLATGVSTRISDNTPNRYNYWDDLAALHWLAGQTQLIIRQVGTLGWYDWTTAEIRPFKPRTQFSSINEILVGWLPRNQIVLIGEASNNTVNALTAMALPSITPRWQLTSVQRYRVLPQAELAIVRLTGGSILRLGVDGSAGVVIAESSHELWQPSPDEEWLLYVDYANQQYRLNCHHVGTGESKTLATFDNPPTFGGWSPDSHWIFLNAENANGDGRLYQIPVAGGKLSAVLTDDKPATFVGWGQRLIGNGNRLICC